MARFYFDPFFEALTSSGVSIPGATLDFFVTNTTTPKNTFQEAAQTTPNTNPVVADGAGRFPPIYMLEGLYTVIFKDSDGVELGSIDDFDGAGTGTVSTVTVTAPLTETGTTDDPIIGVDTSVTTAIALSNYHLLTTKVG